MRPDGKRGETRSVLRRHYLLHTPDAFVRTPIPGIVNGAAIVHASSALGAGFVQYTAELEPNGTLAPIAGQRFLWLLYGEASLELEGVTHTLLPSAYAFLAAGSSSVVKAHSTTHLAVIEKPYQPLSGIRPPSSIVGREEDAVAVPLNGDPTVLVRSLLPATPAFDFAVNTMSYAPSAALAQVEVHVMEHGLLMLEGAGTYRLADDRMEVEACDFIWMAPFCPQWFVASPNGPAKYLIYKDWNRSPTP